MSFRSMFSSSLLALSLCGPAVLALADELPSAPVPSPAPVQISVRIKSINGKSISPHAASIGVHPGDVITLSADVFENEKAKGQAAKDFSWRADSGETCKEGNDDACYKSGFLVDGKEVDFIVPEAMPQDINLTVSFEDKEDHLILKNIPASDADKVYGTFPKWNHAWDSVRRAKWESTWDKHWDQPDYACIQSLSQGVNKFKVKMSVKALTEFRRGLEKYAGNIKEKRQGLLVDYSINSQKKRAFFVDFKACEVLSYEYVIHGGAVYHPEAHYWGDPQQDGLLKACRHDGVSKNMTRPGFFVTAGCHQTGESNWTELYGDCQGVKLKGLEKVNAEAFSVGIVLHEHEAISNDSSVKPMGQGCPAFPPGKLKAMLNYGVKEGSLVYLYVPQCLTRFDDGQYQLK